LDCFAQGFSTARYWRSGGTSLDSRLKLSDFLDETYPTSFYLPALEYTQTSSSGYLIEALGYLVPKATGTVRFHCPADDHLRFYLSDGESYFSSALKLICNRPSWTGFRQYATVSAPVSLVAGKKYFFQALFTDGKSLSHNRALKFDFFNLKCFIFA
jgi:hypothetical protein